MRSLESCNTDSMFIFYSIDVIGISNLHHNEGMCSVCHSPIPNGVCSTRQCTSQDAKIPADDVVDIVSFDLLLVNLNMNLLRQYQQQARNRVTFDERDVVRGRRLPVIVPRSLRVLRVDDDPC